MCIFQVSQVFVCRLFLNQTSFLFMKKIILFSLLLLAFGCTYPKSKISTAEVEKKKKIQAEVEEKKIQYDWHSYHVIEIDSCEYLESDGYTGVMVHIITHKGNCKYCKIRNKK